MKKTFVALMLGLMSIAGIQATNRQVSTTLPANTPSVEMTIAGQQHVVKPTKAVMKEVDAQHVECLVYAGKDKAKVTLPISYDTVMKIGLQVAEIARGMNLITEDQWETIYLEYKKQVGTAVDTK